MWLLYGLCFHGNGAVACAGFSAAFRTLQTLGHHRQYDTLESLEYALLDVIRILETTNVSEPTCLLV